MKAHRAWAEEQQRAEEEEWRREKEADRLQAEEKKRIAKLAKQLSAWEHACSIRRLIHAVREAAARRGDTVPGGPVDQWIRWAEGHADAIDPVFLLVTDSSAKPP